MGLYICYKGVRWGLFSGCMGVLEGSKVQLLFHPCRGFWRADMFFNGGSQHFEIIRPVSKLHTTRCLLLALSLEKHGSKIRSFGLVTGKQVSCMKLPTICPLVGSPCNETFALLSLF